MYFKNLLIALICSLCFFTICCAKSNDEQIDFTLKDLDDNSVSLADYRGKVVFLDFWATWCPPCRASIPKVEELYNEYKNNEDFVILGINAVENKNDVEKFLENNKINYKVLLGTEQVMSNFSIRGIPAFFIIDKDGKIADKFVGYSAGAEELWKKSIDKNLK